MEYRTVIYIYTSSALDSADVIDTLNTSLVPRLSHTHVIVASDDL
jgi:hypothetical protein